MNRSYTVHGLNTGIITPGSDITDLIIRTASDSRIGIRDGDVITIAESAVATAEGDLIRIDTISPSEKAMELAQRYQMEAEIAEIVLRESDEIIGGIPGFLLSIRQGHLLPNAGVDGSNAPDGHVTLLPREPDRTASAIRKKIHEDQGVKTGIVIIDSRTHPMRYGCTAIAIGCSGFSAVIDERGRKDLFGKELKVTRRAVADSIASAAEIVMGEADEGIPVVLFRDLGITLNEEEGIEQISADECLYMGSLRAQFMKR